MLAAEEVMNDVRSDPGHDGPIVASLECLVTESEHHWRHDGLWICVSSREHR